MTLLSAPVKAVPMVGCKYPIFPVWQGRHPLVLVGGGLLSLLVILALAAPLNAGDPVSMDPFKRLQPPSAEM